MLGQKKNDRRDNVAERDFVLLNRETVGFNVEFRHDGQGPTIIHCLMDKTCEAYT